MVSDIKGYLKETKKWAHERGKTATSARMREILKQLEDAATQALKIALLTMVVAVIAYFAYEVAKRRLMCTVAGSAIDIAEMHRIGHFANSPEFQDLDRLLDQIQDLTDEVEANDRVEQFLREKISPVKVDPFPRGFAVEDFRADQLEKGKDPYVSLRRIPNFPVIDAVKGKSIMDGPVRVYRNADVVSIKSTHRTDYRYLINEFERRMKAPLVNKKLPWAAGNVRVETVRTKTLELIFEQGTLSEITPETRAALRAMKQRCRANRINFGWFVFSEEGLEDGEVFLRKLRRAE